jgi:putative transcriptional regulator
MKGLEIKKWRGKLKLSQQKLAEMIGVTTGTVNKWELGKASPSPLAIEKINKLIEKQRGE